MMPSPYLTAFLGLKHSVLQLRGLVAGISQLSPSPGLGEYPHHSHSHLLSRDSPHHIAGDMSQFQIILKCHSSARLPFRVSYAFVATTS